MRLGGFQPFTLSDFPGLPAAIVFTRGCNFRCPYCHNRSLWSPDSRPDSDPDSGQLLGFLGQRLGMLHGVVITGGEPTLQAGLPDFIRELRERGLQVKLDTNGSNPEMVETLVSQGLLSYLAMDLKAPPEKYRLLCGCPVDLQKIRATIEIIAASGVSHHFRTTFDTRFLEPADLEAIRQLLPANSDHLVQVCRLV